MSARVYFMKTVMVVKICVYNVSSRWTVFLLVDCNVFVILNTTVCSQNINIILRIKAFSVGIIKLNQRII